MIPLMPTNIKTQIDRICWLLFDFEFLKDCFLYVSDFDPIVRHISSE